MSESIAQTLRYHTDVSCRWCGGGKEGFTVTIVSPTLHLSGDLCVKCHTNAIRLAANEPLVANTAKAPSQSSKKSEHKV
jgi:hypothetical protein